MVGGAAAAAMGVRETVTDFSMPARGEREWIGLGLKN
ncbi:hypothetical protein A2U01_0060114 [Trifolium medium]|uniref:Uncharacterized protein n=1 Tax=Trifolium medium TaxID=97028 RepID=A0A392RTF6_9FABA|nr:hypothetical protein [Trifolium medium]